LLLAMVLKSMLKNLFILCILCGLNVKAQTQISGVVKDAKTNDVLPFASIIFQNNRGLLTDANGTFNIDSKEKIDSLLISYVGYKTKSILIKKTKYLTILLAPSVEQLQTVVLNAPENPAIALIKKVIKYKF